MDATVTPVDTCWWQEKQIDLPDDNSPLLAPYAETRPGFEVLFGPAEHFTVDATNRYRVCLWDIWTQNDPAEQDAVKQRINAMQAALGPLDDERRYLRLQIACLRRCYYAFPATVDTVLQGIAAGIAQLEMALSCEPPWADLRLALRRRRGLPITQPNERQMRAYAYLIILTGWVAGAALAWLQHMLPEHAALAETTYCRLRSPDAVKAAQVQRVCAALLVWAFPSTERWDSRWERLNGLLQAQHTLANPAGHEDRLGQLIAWNNDQGTCHHSFFRHLDYQLAMIGVGGPVTLPGQGDERRRIQDAVTNYVHALGSWLARRLPEDAAGIWPPAEEIVRNLYGILGTETPVKRWLVASLWQQLQENQAHHGRGALDTEPERFALPEGTLA